MHGIDEAPNIICHTDYYHSWTGLDVELPLEGKVLFDGKGTKIVLTEQHPLTFSQSVDVDYHGRDYFRYYNRYFDPKPSEPTVYFLKIKLFSDVAGEIDTHAFYFIFENYHFLEELIIRQKLSLTHFIKVREGCGFGGCRNSISVFYSLLGNIGVKYLLIDDEIHYDSTIHDYLALKWGINHKKFQLLPLHRHQIRLTHNFVANRTLGWSSCSVYAFKVELLDGDLTKKDLDGILKQISCYDDINSIYSSNRLFSNYFGG
jgi:hypothetical protein